jgi:hypothetical protein
MRDEGIEWVRQVNPSFHLIHPCGPHPSALRCPARLQQAATDSTRHRNSLYLLGR